MATDTEPINSMEDDVTFERMRNMPKRTNFYSTHRKLSWQCDRDVKQFEKDRNLTTYELAREKTSMVDRLNKLQEAQRQIQERRLSDPAVSRTSGRRNSEPCIMLVNPSKSSPSPQTSTKDEGKPLEAPSQGQGQVTRPNRRLYSRRNTVAEGMEDTARLSLLRRLTMPTLGESGEANRSGGTGKAKREKT